ncbi:hypothetical protein LAD67_07760 [Escherichia coli]|nr:hypothetical protein [Escherichia coli]
MINSVCKRWHQPSLFSKMVRNFTAIAAAFVKHRRPFLKGTFIKREEYYTMGISPGRTKFYIKPALSYTARNKATFKTSHACTGIENFRDGKPASRPFTDDEKGFVSQTQIV